MSRAEIGHGLGCITFVITTRTLGPVSIIMPNIIDRERTGISTTALLGPQSGILRPGILRGNRLFKTPVPLAQSAPMGRHKEQDSGRFCEMVAMASKASLLNELFLWVRAMESSDQPTHGV